MKQKQHIPHIPRTLAIHKLPENRRLYLLDLANKLKYKPDLKDWANRKLPPKEWIAFSGYLKSKEYKYGAKTLHFWKYGGPVTIIKKARSPKESQEYLKSLSYKDYLNTNHWKILRNKVLIRDQRCKICNSMEKLNAHHRSYLNKGNPSKELDDIVLLCKDCHELFHKNSKIKEF